MGKTAGFCRFAGCNLWSGLEKDRAKAICQSCDTDFVGTDGFGDGKFKSAEELAKVMANTWTASPGGEKYVVLTGGEPTLQVEEDLVEALDIRYQSDQPAASFTWPSTLFFYAVTIKMSLLETAPGSRPT